MKNLGVGTILTWLVLCPVAAILFATSPVILPILVIPLVAGLWMCRS